MNLLMSVEKMVMNQLWRDYQRRSRRQGIARAYEALEREHSVWTDSLFDDHFLLHGASEVLNGYLDGKRPPDPAELASAWADQMNVGKPMHAELVSAAKPVASYFLQSLDNEPIMEYEL